MVAAPIRYAAYMDSGDYEQLQLPRRVGPWSLESARYCSLVYFLVAVNHDERTVLGCSYVDSDEFARDVALLQSIPPGDTGGGGVLAPLSPFPPFLAPGYCEPIPCPPEPVEPNGV